MGESKRSHWRKLDNAALAFPAATGKHDTRVFRFYCLLKETAEPECLQEALTRTLEKYPLFRAVLRKGLFWFYLERRELDAQAHKENRPPCSKIYVPDQKSLLFEVTYYKNRISLEVFHALTDGTGATLFFKELLKNYLRLAHPGAEIPEAVQESGEFGSDYEEDGFSQYYAKDGKSSEKKKSAYQLPGPKLEQDEMQIMEAVLSAGEVHACARRHGVSVTVFLTAALLCAIARDVPLSRRRKPVCLMIPINLRNYFPSSSMTNFFSWLEAGYQFGEATTFEEVLAHTKEVFAKELCRERIAAHMNTLVRLEKHPLLRAVPLEIKNLFLMAGTTLGGRSITAIYSNIGRIALPEEYGAYVERFGFFTSTDKLQLCTSSYGDKLAVGVTSKLPSENIQRNFLKVLRQQGIRCETEENDFPGYADRPRQGGKKAFQVFTFLCTAAIVLSWMANMIVTPKLLWAGFATAGVLCMWATAAVGYKKRRNLLKNIMWQTLMVSVFCILWDVFTGWHFWSVDYVLPAAALTGAAAMAAAARIRRMETAEYLFYILQGCAFGCIPLILLACGALTVTSPSVLCSGICVLAIAGMLIFRWKEVVQEAHKKFRM